MILLLLGLVSNHN